MAATERPIEVGLIGCGWIAEIAHVPALAASASARLAAVCEPSPSRRDWVESQLDGVRLLPLDELLRDPGINAVIVAVPSALHVEVASAAFDAGKHVYLEKPLALEAEEGLRVVGAWQRSGKVGMVGFNFRHSRVAHLAGEALRAGELGELRAMQGAFLWAAERIEGWRASPEAGGGVLSDLASHHIDLAQALSGCRVTRVRCSTQSVQTGEDSASLDLTLESGAKVQLLTSFVTGVQVNRVELFGSTGSLLVDLLDPLPNPVVRKPGAGARLKRGQQAVARLHPRRLLHAPGREPSFSSALAVFFDAIRGVGAPHPTPMDALRTLIVSDAARRSAASGGIEIEIEPETSQDVR